MSKTYPICTMFLMRSGLQQPGIHGKMHRKKLFMYEAK